MDKNPSAKISCELQTELSRLLVGKRKSGKALELLGCSIESFKMYLESHFDVGMSWENYGKGKEKWQLDHIIPRSLFDLTKPDHQKRCFHFSNLQPLWEIENQQKQSERIKTLS